MFEGLLEKNTKDIDAIRLIIKTNDKLRLIISSQTQENLDDHYDERIDNLISIAPPLTEWRIYDHCSVVTRLYALYENFVEDLIKDWLVSLPEICSSYFDLEPSIQKTHRDGVGYLLQKKHQKRYEHLTVSQVVKGLFDGISSVENSQCDKYELLADAFLIYEQNLRKDSLEKLFKGAGIQNTWSWVDNHREIKQYIQEVRGNENSAENELEQFIEYRNEAAHGTPVDQLLGSNNLLNLCIFVEGLCRALTELVTYRIIQGKLSIGGIKKIGIVTEWYDKPKAAVAKLYKESNFSIGDSVYLVSESRSQCCSAKIKSIQVNDEAQISIRVEEDEQEIGLKFDISAKKDFELFSEII
jgi:MAE_28990/MAE_18760-like HEPN